MSRLVSRLLTVTGVAVLTVTATAGTALAHVTASSTDAAQDGFGVITFGVPSESETASTVEVKVQLPADQPLGFVSVQPKAGWTYTTVNAKLATPITTDDGQVTEAVSVIDWKATAGGVKPGEFDEFRISVGPLPKADSMVFKVIQTYSDKSSVGWIDEPAPSGGAEPEHPAPTLKLAAAAADGEPAGQAPSASAAVPGAAAAGAAAPASGDSATKGSVLGAYVLGAAGLVVGLVGLALGLGARRRRDSVVGVESERSVGAGAE
jgi:uncharacterized protein YcnI